MRVTRIILASLLLVLLLTGCAKEATVQKKPLTEMEKFMFNTGLDNIQWMSVGWRVEEKNEYGIYSSTGETKVLSKDENARLLSDIEKAISLGTYQEKAIDPPLDKIHISIRLFSGKVIDAFFDGEQIIFPVPRTGMYGISGDKGIVINPGKDFASIIDNIKSGKTKIKPKVRTQPEIRNQRVVLNEQALFYAYNEDPAFENFDETKIDNYKKYNDSFIKAAQKKGMKSEKVKEAMSLLDKDNFTVKIPVILEVGQYEGKNVMILVYKWENKGMLEQMAGKNPRLGHIVIYIFDQETNKILKTTSCG